MQVPNAPFLLRYPTAPVSLERPFEEEAKEDRKPEPVRPGKRRSKNDQNGRSYKCGCGKMYLSYPALYTHIKTKHDMVQPEGTYGPQFRNGRGRGRPRKLKDTTEPPPVPQTHESDNIRKNPNFADEVAFVREIGEYSDFAADPFSSFPLLYEKNAQVEHPLLLRIREVVEDANKAQIGQYTPHDTSADYVFAVFLWEHSLVCKAEFYKFLVHLITALHKFLCDQVEKDYTRIRDPGEVPLYSNEFLGYLKATAEKVNEEKVKVVWRHFCEWMYAHGYTAIRLESEISPAERNVTTTRSLL